MRALKKEPGKPWVSVEIDNELKPLQKAVGGYLESFTFSEDACILCDEEHSCPHWESGGGKTE